jgi:hypothetical protein
LVTGQVSREIPLLVEKPRRDDAAKQQRDTKAQKLGLIGVHTPVAQALLGSAVGAEVLARLPGGLKKLKVLAIQKHSIAHPAVSIPAF